MFEDINLHKELLKEQERIQQHLIDHAKELLSKDEEYDRSIHRRLASSEEDKSIPTVHRPENIFSLETIRNICTRYRLRFLETKHLRYPLPYEAYIRIKEFEKQHGCEVKQFSIMAPARAFKLDKKTDPLLFAHLGNNRYYLLHKWGNDLSWTRSVLMFPLKNLYTLFATILLTSFAVAFFIPKDWIVNDASLYPLMYNFRLFLFFLLSTGSFATLFYIGITRNKALSEDAWNSKWI